MSLSQPRAPELSLVRYDSQHREIVLKHRNAVVVYDHRLHELSLRADPVDHDYSTRDCPYCHRPLDATFDSDEDSITDVHPPSTSTSSSHAFVDPDYFRMLAHSLPAAESPRNIQPALRSLPEVAASTNSTPSRTTASSNEPSQESSAGIRGSSFVPGYFSKFFVEKKLLGRGGRGVVHLVEHFLDGVSLGEFACKKIAVGNDHDWLAKVLLEVQLLQQLNHANLVSYRHVWLEDAQLHTFGPSVPCVFILQQYCNAGDLHSHVMRMQAERKMTLDDIRRNRRRMSTSDQPATSLGELKDSQRMSLDQIFSFFRDMTLGLHHLHTHGYIHRDLKPSNCLLHDDGQNLTVLVSDFGEVQAATAQRASSGATGTISYCSPEVLRQNATSGLYNNFSTSSDVFSLGMIVYFMCFARLPYLHSDVDEEREDLELLRKEILDWPGLDNDVRVRDDLPERLYRFLKKLLSLDPDQRPSTEGILTSIRGTAGLEAFDLSYKPADNPSRQTQPMSPVDRARRRNSLDPFQSADADSEDTIDRQRVQVERSDRMRSANGRAVVLSTHKLRRFSSNEATRPLLILPAPKHGLKDANETSPALPSRAAHTAHSAHTENAHAEHTHTAFAAPSPLTSDAFIRSLYFLLFETIIRFRANAYPCTTLFDAEYFPHPLVGLMAWELGYEVFRARNTLVLVAVQLALVLLPIVETCR